MNAIKAKKEKIFFIIILVLVSVFFVLLPRFSYGRLSESPYSSFYTYPLHTDEWQHYTISMSLEENFFHPHVFYYENYEPFIDGSPFFHEIIFFAQKLGLSPDKFFVLPILQGIFFVLIFFFFLSLFFNPSVSFIGSLLVFSLQSDVRILGLVFFKPFVLGFCFLLLALIIFQRKKRVSFAFVIFSLMSFFCYPPLVLLLIIYVFVYGLVNKKIDKKYLFYIGFLIVLALLFGLIIFKNNASFLMDKIIYKGYLSGQDRTTVPEYLNILLVVLGLLGFLKTIKKKEFWPCHSLFIFLLLDFILATIFRFSLGFHYMRIIYFIGIFLGVYVAYILVYIFKNFSFFSKRKTLATVCLFLIVLAILVPNFKFYARSLSSFNPAVHARWLGQNNLQVLEYLKERNNKEAKLLHLPYLGAVITPLTGFKATAVFSAFTGGKKNKYDEIFNSPKDCQKIKEIIDEENYNLLWMKRKIDCPFLELIFNNNFNFIYQYNPTIYNLGPGV